MEVLFPEGKVVVVGGESFIIKPFTFGQIPKVVGAVKKIAGMFQGEQVNVLDVIEQGGEDVLALVSMVTGKPRAWFDSVPADEGIALVTAIYEVNADFFAKKVAPLLPTFLSPKEPNSPDGEASPDDSSATDTAGKTSKATP